MKGVVTADKAAERERRIRRTVVEIEEIFEKIEEELRRSEVSIGFPHCWKCQRRLTPEENERSEFCERCIQVVQL